MDELAKVNVNGKEYHLKDETARQGSGGNVDPTAYGLPILYLNGDTSAMTKENAVNLDYVYGEQSGTASVKWQGSSSLAYPKKNYTIKFDNAFEASAGWGVQKKYCLKANFIDHSHARNIVSAKLWGEIVKTRIFDSPGGTNLFDFSKVTKITDQNGSEAGFALITNSSGENWLRVTSPVALSGYPLLIGQTYEPGTYTVVFEAYNGNTDETNNVNVLVAGFTKPGSAVCEKSIEFTKITEWTRCEVTVTNDVPGASFFLSGYYGVGNSKCDMFFRNIQVIKQGGATSADEIARISDLVNGGAVDGFPVVIMMNNAFHGLYTFNIPKDGWMMGMGEGANEAILCADYSDACWFKGEATLNGDFDLEYVSNENDTAWVTTSVNRLINACMNSDGTDLDSTIAQYLDWVSAVDYYIFKVLLGGVDMGGKNYILATYDGTKWFFSAYDMDCVYGLDWDGKKFYKAINENPFGSGHTVDNLILTYKKNLLKARYAELRSGVMSDDNVATMFTNFVGSIPAPLFIEDVKKWPTIPNTAVNNLGQIVDYYTRRAKWLDKYMETL